MDRGTARTFVSLKCEDPDQTKISPDKYNSAIDQAEEMVAIETGCLRKTTTLTLTDSVAYVALPVGFLRCILVTHKGLKLTPTTKMDLTAQRGDDWSTLTGTPKAFYVDEENQRIVTVPIAIGADAGAYLGLFYEAVPDAPVDDTTVLLNAKTFLTYYHPAIVALAAYFALGWVPATQEIMVKKADNLKEYEYYKEKAISIYDNMADQPLRMKGGRRWQDGTGKRVPNAFDI